MAERLCCICERPFEFGCNVYQGRTIPGWRGLMICRNCDKINHDGAVANASPHLITRLEGLGVQIILNDEGHIVVPNIR